MNLAHNKKSNLSKRLGFINLKSGQIKTLISELLILDCKQNLQETLLDKTNKIAFAPSEDSDQPGHSPSLNRVFVVRMKKPWDLSYPMSVQRRLWSDWADAQADLSLRWAHMPFCWFCREAQSYDLHLCPVLDWTAGFVFSLIHIPSYRHDILSFVTSW